MGLFYVSSFQLHPPFRFHSHSLSLPVCTEGRGQAAFLFLPDVATKCFIKTRTKYECLLCEQRTAISFLFSEGPCCVSSRIWQSKLIVMIRGQLCNQTAAKQIDSVYCCIESENAKIHLCLSLHIIDEHWKETVQEWQSGTKASKVSPFNELARSHANELHSDLCLTLELNCW